MIVSFPSRGIGAAALAAGLLIAGCSSDSDVPKTTVSAPDGGTQANTDTGSGGDFPDINTVPTQRPTSTIQDLSQAPNGLSGAQSGTQYGGPLVGGPTSSAAPPVPPPPPPQEELAPIPETGIKTQQSDAAPPDASAPPADGYAAPAETSAASNEASAAPTEDSAALTVASTASNEPIATPEIAEPQPMEPIAEAVPAPDAPQGQTIQGTTGQTAAVANDVAEPAAAPDATVQVAAAASSAPQPSATPVVAVQPAVAPEPANVQPPSLNAPQQAQLPTSPYAPNDGSLAPSASGAAVPQPVLPPYQPYNPAQAMYRSPYANPPTNYGGAVAAPMSAAPAPMMAATYASYGQPYYGGQPVGLVFFSEGSSGLSPDDHAVLKQIAEMQRAYGGAVNVVGHASMRTSTMDYARHQQANQRISEARANAVARQLVTYGVPQDAIRVSAAGDSQPLYSEVMPSGEAANRRAEIYLSAY